MIFLWTGWKHSANSNSIVAVVESELVDCLTVFTRYQTPEGRSERCSAEGFDLFLHSIMSC